MLLQLLEAKTNQNDIQIITTSHSPQLLRLLSAEAQEEAFLIYRLPNSKNEYIPHSVGKLGRDCQIPTFPLDLAIQREQIHVKWEILQKILDIPNIRSLIQKQDLAHLHESGWFEDAMAFLDGAEGMPAEK